MNPADEAAKNRAKKNAKRKPGTGNPFVKGKPTATAAAPDEDEAMQPQSAAIKKGRG